MVFWNLWLYTNFPTMKFKIAWWLSSQSKAARSVISELIPLKWDYSEYRMASGSCNPWRHQHQRREAFLQKKLIKGPLSCHGTFAEFESITSKERSEWNQWSLWKGLYTALTAWRHCRGFSMPVLPPMLYSSLSWDSDRNKKHRKRKKKQLMLLW